MQSVCLIDPNELKEIGRIYSVRGKMKRLCLIATVVLIGCAKRYPYSGTPADVERGISMLQLGLTKLVIHERGETWIRYRIIQDASGMYITNGSVTVRVEDGQISVTGPRHVREAIYTSLKVK